MRDAVRLSLILGLICVISAMVLSGIDGLTRERIEEANARKLEEALAQVLPGESGFRSIDDLEAVLGDHLNSVAEVYVASGDGRVGIAVKARPVGYGGPIDVVVGVDGDGEVSGVRVISQSETPGLGAEVTREAFTTQFEGHSDLESLKVRQDGGTIDAITGATISSRAVASGVRDALETFARLEATGLLIDSAVQTSEEGSN